MTEGTTEMRGTLAGLVTVATAFITAGIVYQVVKPGSQGPKVVKEVGTTVRALSGDLFKG